ncbi:MAG: polysaccharide biosynthesis/export family protein [Prevotella sp.]
MKSKTMAAAVLGLLLLTGCAAPNVSYFNNLEHNQNQIAQEKLDIRLRPDDKISIVVNSKDAELADLFNLPVISHRVGYTNLSGSNSSQQISVYTVTKDGTIDFPVLGMLKVEGKRRDEVGTLIKGLLIEKNLVKDPVVTVEYGNLGFDVLGEVSKAGRYSFDRDHLTVLDAISMAGDLTIQGRRDNVFVMRDNGDTRTTYRLDLQDGKKLLQSPAFYLQQNDVVYVSPNKYRSRQTTANGNTILSASFWLSCASFLTSVIVLITK